jgi:protein arginine kinase activator
MMCCVCKEKQATVHLTQIDSDKVQKVDLCEECAKQKGLNDPTGFSLADLLMGLGASQELEQATPAGDLVCPTCGFSQADFKKAGRLGCADCYRTFRDGLETLLKTIHRGTRHIGKVPHALQQSHDLTEKLRQAQKTLDKAVQAEDYEQAAVLRDEIKRLKARIHEASKS